MLTYRQVYRGSQGALPGRASWGAEYAAGKDLTARLPVKVPAGDSILRAVCTVKRNLSDTDAQAVIQKVITTTLSASGQVTDTGVGDGRGEIVFEFTPVQTALFNTPLYYSIDVVLNSGDVLEYESGQVFFPRVATKEPAGAGTVDHIDMSPSAIGVVQGSNQLFVATPRDQANNALAGRVVDWFTTDESIATVDTTGLVTTKAEGSVKIGAAVEGVVGFADLTISVDDTALLIANTGGDVRWPGVYDARRNVRHLSNAVHAVDDVRCNTATGRVVLIANHAISAVTTALRNVSKFTKVIWSQGSFAFDFSAETHMVWYTDGVEFIYKASIDTVFCYIGSSLANHGSFVLPGNLKGSCFMFGVVYDGTGGTNADRLKMYYRVYDKATQTWGALVAPALSFTGTIPATVPASGGPDTTKIGYSEGLGQYGRMCIDEMRLWIGTALSQAQLDQEATTADPNLAQYRWVFAGNLNNTGQVGGLTLTDSAGTPMFNSDDIRWGDPFMAANGEKPTYDPSALTITFDGVNSGLIAIGGSLRLITADSGLFIVSSYPVWSGTQEYWWQLANPNSSNGLPASLASYNNASLTFQALAESGTPALSYSSESGRRLVQYRRARAGGDVTLGVKQGSAAELTNTAAAGADTVPGRLCLGRRPDSTSHTDMVWRALWVRKGDYLAAVQTSVQDWSVLRHSTPA